MSSEPPDPKQVAAALAVLEAFAEDRGLMASVDAESRQRLVVAAGRLAHPGAKEERKLRRAFRKKAAAEKRAADEAVLDGTGIRAARKETVYQTPPAELAGGTGTPRLIEPGDRSGAPFSPKGAMDGSALPVEREVQTSRNCYICKEPYTKIHHFYDALCGACGELNYAKRIQTADLRGRIALVTGGRVKIGYHAVVKLLRAGARVVVTTRFARDAAARFAKEQDYEAWGKNIEVYGLDLRHTPSVEQLAEHLLATLPRLDFIIHNACQTVRRPPAFYGHLLEREAAPFESLSVAERPIVAGYEELRRKAVGMEPARLSQKALLPEDRALPSSVALFPEGQLDADLQQVDLRAMNSWRLRMHEVPTVELLEVHLVNAVAPFVLSARLKSLLVKDRTFDKQIVNVSAMEGQFYRARKTANHPHTNMAKAALNMLTRTSSQDYAVDGIFMNSVDTGWVTDEDPIGIAEKKALEQGQAFQPPLDIVDGAARIVDPIFHGINSGEHVWGKFLKDYRQIPW